MMKRSLLVGSILALTIPFLLGTVHGIVFAAVLAMLAAANLRLRRILLRQVPSILRDRERNYDNLVVGVASNLPSALTRQGRTRAFQFPGRDLRGSELVLHRMFSYLKAGGTVYLVLPSLEPPRARVDIADLPFVHEVTAGILGLKWVRFRREFPLVASPVRGVQVLLAEMRRHLADPVELVPEAVAGTADLVRIRDFCRRRNLGFRVFTCSPGGD